MSVSDIAASIVEPVNKLIDAVTTAIGTAYTPRHIKKIADAKAYEIRVIGEELRKNADLPIVYDDTGNVSIDISDYSELAKRTGKRLAYQEITKQENLESIIDSAYEKLCNSKELSKGEITREWMHRFIDTAGDISTQELQELWSKVLAGEVLDPKSFSIRTLECLRNLDVNDARCFEKNRKYVINNNYILSDDIFMQKYEILYADILGLDESGLIKAFGDIALKTIVTRAPKVIIDFGDYALVAKAEKDIELIIGQFPLTAAGRELLSVIGGEKMEIEMIKDICSIVADNEPNIDFKLFEVIDRIEKGIRHGDEEIPFRVPN